MEHFVRYSLDPDILMKIDWQEVTSDELEQM